MRRRRGDHVDQFRLIRRRHDREARQVGEVRHVERPRMGGPVRPDQPGAVDGEAHRQPLDRHVMHHLIVAALQEGRIDRAERLHPPRRQPGAEGHAMLLGDAHVEAALREPLREQVQPGAVGHRGGDGDDPVVALGLADQARAKTLV
jgi:hypothetical protein